MPDAPAAVEVLKRSLTSWGILLGICLACIVLTFWFLVLSFRSELRVLTCILFLGAFAILMKIPDRYSSIGGTDVGMACSVMIASAVDMLSGVVFAFLVTIIGGKVVSEGPQYTVVSTIIHVAVAVMASFFVLNPENLLFICLGFIIAGHAVGCPSYIAMGNPAQRQLLFSIINIIWNFVLIRNFGPTVLTLLS